VTTHSGTPPVTRAIVALYAMDLDIRNTSSMGIVNYTRRLIQALALCPPPGFQVVLLVTPRNAGDIVPAGLPFWMTARVVPCRCSGIVSRLWVDHVLSGYYARKVGARVIHFPKGFAPVWGVRGRRIVATVHDTIVFYYARHFPGWFPVLKTRYFCWMTLRVLRRAERVLTDSTFSREELIGLVPAAAGKTEAVHFGAGIIARAPLQSRARHGVMVLGSLFPHKATCQTLRLLDEYAVHKGVAAMEVVVTGLSQWPCSWGTIPEHLALSFRGRVLDAEMASLYGESCALVLLSEIEGFGLPAIESFEAGTPVCYRASTSLAEILEGVPGGWGGGSGETFFAALDAALSLSLAEVAAIRTRLAEKCDWGRASKRVLEVYGEELRKAGWAPEGEETQPRFPVLETGISAVTFKGAIEAISGWISRRERRSVHLCNAEVVLQAYDDPALAAIINASGLALPDGMPLVWIGRRRRLTLERVYGPDLMLALCEYGLKRGWRHYFYGGTPGVLEDLIGKLSERFPGLQIAGSLAPPFRPLTPGEESDVEASINAASPDVIWVGIGTPKQDFWMARFRPRLNAAVMIAVGAAFNFHAGHVRQAPRWMMRCGLEWLFRLSVEPGRLWRRYLVGIPRFLWLVSRRAICR